jgi:hypothetical protein
MSAYFVRDGCTSVAYSPNTFGLLFSVFRAVHHWERPTLQSRYRRSVRRIRISYFGTLNL